MDINKLKKHYDLNDDGQVDREEIELAQSMIDGSNGDQRADAQRKMTWFALFGMLLYPLLVLGSSLIGLEKSAEILGDMAATYFVSVAGIVAAFFGTEAFRKNK